MNLLVMVTRRFWVSRRKWYHLLPKMGVSAAAISVLAACGKEGVIDPRGPVSAAELLILLNATTIMSVVVVPVIVLTLLFAWWYRSSNPRATRRTGWAYSGRAEFVVWSIPTMVVILLGCVGWIGAHDLDPGRSLQSNRQPVRIQVVSMDWKWLFIYPDDKVAAVNQLIVPTGTPLEFTLTSATVMNSFFVPQLGSQIYTMPGMTTHLNLLAPHSGDYPGFSAHFSGDGFSDMRFVVRAVSPGDFKSWIATATKDTQPLLGAAVYEQLQAARTDYHSRTFGHVDSALFEHILQAAAPARSSSEVSH